MEKPYILWLMGPTSSGKTTLAEAFVQRLRGQGKQILHYDGDEVRDFFGPNLSFSGEDRLRVVNTIVHLANKAQAAGITVVVSALTANNDARSLIRDTLDNLLLGYVKCSIEECANRDPKGLYAKAKNGEITTLAGYNTSYEPPENPLITLNTECSDVTTLLDELEAAVNSTTRGERP